MIAKTPSEASHDRVDYSAALGREHCAGVHDCVCVLAYEADMSKKLQGLLATLKLLLGLALAIALIIALYFIDHYRWGCSP